MIFVRFWSTNHIKSQIASLFILAIFVNLFIYSSSYAKSNALVADLSQSDISINTDFNGASLLLFGSISGEIGDDIIVLISGPSSEVNKAKIIHKWNLGKLKLRYMEKCAKLLSDIYNKASISNSITRCSKILGSWHRIFKPSIRFY